MHPGDVLASRFQLEVETARGGMGQVFRAHDRFAGAPVAVKVLRERRDGWDTRFLREAEMLASLHHPSIVRHVAHGSLPGGERYLVMEWLQGEDLATRLLRGPLSYEHTLALARQVADALALAHGRGVVHRDLKPQNLWLLEGGTRVKVLDFGVARLEAHSSLSHSALIGTPGYMAPEQVRGTFDVDARADVFALGCVLHECLSGQPLFRADHLIGLLAKILLEPAASLRGTLPELPAQFDALLVDMLAKEREQRPADGAEVCRRLDGQAAAERVRADNLSLAERRTRTLLLIGSGVGNDGSTPDFAQRTPGEAEQRVRAIVGVHGGSLEELADGTAIVSFGDSVATDRAARAARCALALAPFCRQRALSLVTGRGDEGTRIGAAIDRGTAALASVSPECGGGPIAIDTLTANLLDARFELRESEQGVLLTRERELSHGVRSLLGKATACVGRDYELAGLRGAYEACVQERAARAVLVSARPGIGKSRLAVELVEQLRRERPGLAVWVARGDALRTGSAFGLLAQLLRAQLAIREDDPLPRRRACIRERVASVPDAERVASFLGELLAAPFDDHDNAPLRTARRDPQLMHHQLSRAFVDFVRAELAAGPLLWILEDLHWADLPSMRLVDAALAQLAEQPWLVLALARPELLERAPRLWEERGLSVVHLKPLSPRAGARLVTQAVGEEVDAAQVGRMVELAGGNAFYLEELARALGEGKQQLPETVLAMIEARLAGLDDEQRRVLRAASIFGEACWEGGLARLMGDTLDPVRLHHCLTQLVAQELLMLRAESRFAGERELAFRHALLREGAYAQLTAHDRTLGHRLAADWLEQHGEPDHAVLALHLEHGGELTRAGLRYASAAHVANLGADREAVLAHARDGLRCGVPDRSAVELHSLIIMVLGQRSEFDATRPHLQALAELSADDSGLQLTYQLVPIMLRALSAEDPPDLDELAGALESAVRVPLGEGTLDVFGAVVGWAHFEIDAMGHYPISRRTSDRYEARLAEFVGREATAAGWLALHQSYQRMTYADDPITGLALADRALRAFEEAQHPGGRAIARTFVGLHAQGLGLHHQAARALRSAREVDIGTVGSLRDLMHVLSLLDDGLAQEADLESLEMIERTRSRHGPERGRAHWARALVLLRRGDRMGCERELEQTVNQLARWPAEQSSVLLTVAASAMLGGELERALSCCDRAQRIHERMEAAGYRGLVGRLLPARKAEVLAALG
ncbi:MAG: protein kinase, partial [Polyangiales bacterium]